MQDIYLIIIGGKVLFIDTKNTCLDKAAIAINEGNIIAIYQAENIARQYQARKTINAKDSLIMPGFVNCHTHAAITCFRGIADDLELLDWLNNYIFPAEAKNVNKDLAYW